MFCCWGLGCGLGEDGKNPNKSSDNLSILDMNI